MAGAHFLCSPSLSPVVRRVVVLYTCTFCKSKPFPTPNPLFISPSSQPPSPPKRLISPHLQERKGSSSRTEGHGYTSSASIRLARTGGLGGTRGLSSSRGLASSGRRGSSGSFFGGGAGGAAGGDGADEGNEDVGELHGGSGDVSDLSDGEGADGGNAYVGKGVVLRC